MLQFYTAELETCRLHILIKHFMIVQIYLQNDDTTKAYLNNTV